MSDAAGAVRPADAPAAVPVRVRLLVSAGTVLLRLLARTWRIRQVGREPWYERKATVGGPVVIACWHGQLLPLIWHHRGEGVSILVSEHRDGEIIARVAHALGYGTVRGSTSRGGGRALLELVAVLRRGKEVAVTPDGPRGPRHTFAPGALVAAQRAGVPIVGVVAHIDRCWQLRSWDRFEIPKPFARITVAYSDPTPVSGATPREAAENGPAFAAMFDALRERADAAARARR